MARKFPKFQAHNQAHCFNCGGDFGGGHWDKSGFPRGRGEWKQICNKCGMDTFYDLGSEPAAMQSIIAQNQTVSPGVYARTVIDQASLPHAFMKANAHRIDRAYAAGEPIWMIVAELEMVYATKPNWKPMKSPRELAARVMRVHDRTVQVLKAGLK